MIFIRAHSKAYLWEISGVTETNSKDRNRARYCSFFLYCQIHFMMSYLCFYTNHTQIQQRKESIPIPLLNMIPKIFNEILENQIQEHIKNIWPYDQLEFFLEMKGWFNMWKMSQYNSLYKQTKKIIIYHHFIRCQNCYENFLLSNWIYSFV